ncbi:MAG: hypothetical protein K2Q45_02370 [Nitrosomonas sp.]|nr:hypothetical protein [Nitrosomonas sp.]
MEEVFKTTQREANHRKSLFRKAEINFYLEQDKVEVYRHDVEEAEAMLERIVVKMAQYRCDVLSPNHCTVEEVGLFMQMAQERDSCKAQLNSLRKKLNQSVNERQHWFQKKEKHKASMKYSMALLKKQKIKQ